MAVIGRYFSFERKPLSPKGFISGHHSFNYKDVNKSKALSRADTSPGAQNAICAVKHGVSGRQGWALRVLR